MRCRFSYTKSTPAAFPYTMWVDISYKGFGDMKRQDTELNCYNK